MEMPPRFSLPGTKVSPAACTPAFLGAPLLGNASALRLAAPKCSLLTKRPTSAPLCKIATGHGNAPSQLSPTRIQPHIPPTRIVTTSEGPHFEKFLVSKKKSFEGIQNGRHVKNSSPKNVTMNGVAIKNDLARGMHRSSSGRDLPSTSYALSKPVRSQAPKKPKRQRITIRASIRKGATSARRKDLPGRLHSDSMSSVIANLSKLNSLMDTSTLETNTAALGKLDAGSTGMLSVRAPQTNQVAKIAPLTGMRAAEIGKRRLDLMWANQKKTIVAGAAQGDETVVLQTGQAFVKDPVENAPDRKAEAPQAVVVGSQSVAQSSIVLVAPGDSLDTAWSRWFSDIGGHFYSGVHGSIAHLASTMKRHIMGSLF